MKQMTPFLSGLLVLATGTMATILHVSLSSFIIVLAVFLLSIALIQKVKPINKELILIKTFTAGSFFLFFGLLILNQFLASSLLDWRSVMFLVMIVSFLLAILQVYLALLEINDLEGLSSNRQSHRFILMPFLWLVTLMFFIPQLQFFVSFYFVLAVFVLVVLQLVLNNNNILIFIKYGTLLVYYVVFIYTSITEPVRSYFSHTYLFNVIILAFLHGALLIYLYRQESQHVMYASLERSP